MRFQKYLFTDHLCTLFFLNTVRVRRKIFFFFLFYLSSTRIPSSLLIPSPHHLSAAPGLRPGPARGARDDAHDLSTTKIRKRVCLYREYRVSKTQKFFFFFFSLLNTLLLNVPFLHHLSTILSFNTIFLPSKDHLIYEHHLSKTQKFFFFKIKIKFFLVIRVSCKKFSNLS